MLDIDRGIYTDPRLEKLHHILIPLLISASPDIGMGQLIHQQKLWPPLQRCIQIEFPQLDPLIIHHQRRNFLKALPQSFCIRPVMRLDITGHHIDPTLFCLMSRFQHGVGLSCSSCITKENLHLPPVFFLLPFFLILDPLQKLLRIRSHFFHSDMLHLYEPHGPCHFQVAL